MVMGKKIAFNQVVELPEFSKDFKRLFKKFKSLDEDFKTFQETALKAFHKLNETNVGILPINGLGIEYPQIFKVIKFACKALKGKGSQTGIRLVYAYFTESDKIEFIEIYFKANKENEDRDRIKRYIKTLS